MRRPWEKFNVVSNQVEIEYVNVLRRSRGVLIFEIGTVQKYPEVLAYSGTEMHLMTSKRTPGTQLNESAEATSIIFPRSVRGWAVVTPVYGRYSLTVALYRPGRRRSANKMIPRTDEWRDERFLKGKGLS